MLTREQLDLIPDSHLTAKSTGPLTEWLWARGWTMTLLELDLERRLRRRRSTSRRREIG